ncbi:MAG TPA: peptidyl-prolyl cis-trans isomerase [Saprospiraceae bacterium]|nr:peptidyl-prolyl cis-trans isomerase [Saprospiraceae bacterium]
MEKQVSRGERSKVINQSVIQRIKEKYGFIQGEAYTSFFNKYVSDSILKLKWKYTPIASKDNKVLFTIGNKKVYFDDFARFIESKQITTRRYKTKEAKIEALYEDFKATTIKDYSKVQLEKENPEYAAILDEYRNGLLIFDVMEKNIWDKAKNDSIALEKFYQNNKQNYLWKTRVDAILFSATDKDVAQQVKQMLTENKTADQIKETLNKDGKVAVIISKGIFEIDQRELPQGFEPTQGISKIYNKEDSFVIVQVNDVLSPSIKPLEDVKGKVISDYQNYLEEQWMAQLHQKYNVSVRKKALKKLKKQLKS